MHFDDRLDTVLRQSPRGDAIARIQYRQLVDLLGTIPGDTRSETIDAAYGRLGELTRRIPPADRAVLLSDSGLRLRSPRLIFELMQDAPGVAEAAVAAARLGEDEWLDLIPALPIQARGALAQRADFGPRVARQLGRFGIGARALPPGPPAEEAAGTPHAESERSVTPGTPATGQGADVITLPRRAATRSEPEDESRASRAGRDGLDSIGALVRRIESFRQARKDADAAHEASDLADSPRLPLDDAAHREAPLLSGFDFATDPEGRVIWADAAAAPMVVGLALGSDEVPDALFQFGRLSRIAIAIRRRQPISGELFDILGAPAVTGNWQIDAVPDFATQTGRYTGYVGKARRVPLKTRERSAELAEADRMRQILHELRTPVNAIQMGAEVIQQGLFGPPPHEYRALAASIASDAARILAGFEELDRMVKLESHTLVPDAGETDLATVVSSTVAQLQSHTAPRKSGFSLALRDARLPVGLDSLEAERLVWRILAGIAGATAPSEFLALDARAQDAMAVIDLALPATLAARSEDALFDAGVEAGRSALSSGIFGLGFTLRLAAAEARAAGGWLRREGAALQLALPLLAPPLSNVSQI